MLMSSITLEHFAQIVRCLLYLTLCSYFTRVNKNNRGMKYWVRFEIHMMYTSKDH